MTPTFQADGGTPSKPDVSWRFVVFYVLAQFGIWIALLTPVVLTVALRVGELAGETSKDSALSTIMACGAAAAMIAAPVFGALSDQTKSRFGRRRPWMIGGLFGGALGLAVLGLGQNLIVIGIGWVICQAAFNAISTGTLAALADVIPFQQQGRVSGLLGMTPTVAIAAGTWIVNTVQPSDFWTFLAPFAVTVATVLIFVAMLPDAPFISQKGQASKRPSIPVVLGSIVAPFRDSDYSWAFASRFLIMFAWAFVLTFQLYFLTGHLRLTREAALLVMVQSTSIIAICTLAVSVVGGVFSDWIGRRKPLVFAAAVIDAIGFVMIAMSTSVDAFLLGIAIVALGHGLYFSIDLALVAAILPRPEDTAKDLGTFQIANSLPQSIAPAVAPLLLAIGLGANGAQKNYLAMFFAAGICALLGALAIIPVKRTR